MNHPELLAVPILMFADYALTILGAKLSVGVYREHFSLPTYELNPLWRKSVGQFRWFNPRHVGLVALSTLLLIVLDQTAVLPLEAFDLLLGVYFGAFGSICGHHLTNLLIFRYVNRHPHEISGRIELSLKLTLKMSQFTYVGLIPLFAIVLAAAPEFCTAGFLLGILSVCLAHSVWVRKAGPAEARPPVEVQEGGEKKAAH